MYSVLVVAGDNTELSSCEVFQEHHWYFFVSARPAINPRTRPSVLRSDKLRFLGLTWLLQLNVSHRCLMLSLPILGESAHSLLPMGCIIGRWSFGWWHKRALVTSASAADILKFIAYDNSQYPRPHMRWPHTMSY